MNPKIKVGLIDDEESILDLLTILIRMLPDFEVSFATTDPVKGLEWISRGKAQILITDIVMPELGGLEISRRLLKTGIPIIICSGHQKYAVQGFRVKAVDFLVKPPDPMELTEALLKAGEKVDTGFVLRQVIDEDYVVVGEKLSHRKHFIRPSDILYMEQQEKDSLVYLEKGPTVVLTNPFLVSLAKLKSPFMIRVHQSYAVNIQKVQTLLPDECILISGQSVPVSRTYKHEIQVLMDKKLIR
ncbi:LytR/AlgR family response regulator transcription factor [Algoriphagus terrigena]|uniref:LytR/AlgR family response regulator transcription factor n=1 Tax=Algoriphagus terrigena TaxID=344884 RepID=UPI00040845B4|nr:LytTR family DNA-binding domain-containing protein [Algoriphagus terrigena]